MLRICSEYDGNAANVYPRDAENVGADRIEIVDLKDKTTYN